MPTAQELYVSLLPHALSAYAAKTPDMTSAKQMAHALAEECVNECARLGILGGSGVERHSNPRAEQAPVGTPGSIPQFAQPNQSGGGGMALVPLGTPQQPAQHFNHVGGQEIVPPAGAKYEPPIQAGVMNTVVQVPTPQGYSALGTNGVISQPVQRPNGKDQVIAPSNQAMIPQVGGNGTMFVPERIVK